MATGTSAFAPPAGPQLPQWATDFWNSVSGDAMEVGLRALLAVLLFVLGWLVAKLVAYLVFRVLERTRWDNKLATRLHLESLFAERTKTDAQALERAAASAIYYLLMGLVVVGVLEFAGLTQAAGPIEALVETVASALPLVGKATLVLLAAWAGGTILRRVVARGLRTLRVDERFARLRSPGEPAAAEHAFSEGVGRVVFWLVMLAGLAGAFDALEITPLAEPLRNAIDDLLRILPGLGLAALIVIGGWIIGRLARTVTTNSLAAVGFDRLVERVRLRGVFGPAVPSAVAGWLVMAFVYVQTAIAALDRIGLQTLSRPLTDAMAQFWNVLPVLTVSTLVVALGVLAGRIVRSVLARALQGIGFDRLMGRIGLGQIAQRDDALGRPSEVAGVVAMTAIVLVAVAQALDNLGLRTWAGYVDTFLQFAVSHVLVALAIVAVGFWVGGYGRDLINARQAEGKDVGPQWLGEFVRYVVLVFAATMATQQLGVAEDFVLLSFALLFGGLCLAMALAFGLGSRDVAAEIVRRRWDKVRRESGAPTPGAPVVPPRVGP